MRGIAALSVACFHIYPTVATFQPYSAFLGLCRIGWVGVPVFFVISGFVIANSLKNTKITSRFALNYAARRSLRLDPPYWATIAISVSLSALVARAAHQPWAPPRGAVVIAHAFYMQNILRLGNLSVGLWTLCLEVQFYICCLLLIGISQRLRISVGWLVIPIAFASLLCSTQTSSTSTQPVIFEAYRSLLPNFCMFAIGIVVWLHFFGHAKPWLVFGLMATIAARLVIWYQLGLLVALIAGGVIVIGLRRRLPLLEGSVLQFLGKISYSLYLIHYPVAHTFLLAVKHVFGADATQSFIWCSSAILLSILAATLMNKFIEQPSIALANRLKRRPAPGNGITVAATDVESNDQAPTTTSS